MPTKLLSINCPILINSPYDDGMSSPVSAEEFWLLESSLRKGTLFTNSPDIPIYTHSFSIYREWWLLCVFTYFKEYELKDSWHDSLGSSTK